MSALARQICEDCPSRTRAACLRPYPGSDLAIVVDFPTTLEARRGKLLEGDTGRLLRSIFKAHDVDPRDLYVTSALNCRPVGTKETILRPAMEACRSRLVRELREAGAKRALCLGPIAYAALASHDRIARTVKVRGRWKHAYGMQILGTYAPVSVLADIELFRDLAFDIAKFLTTDGKEPYPDVSVLIARTPKEVRKAFDQMRHFEWVSCDFENTGFSPVKDVPLALGYAAVDPDDPALGLGWVMTKEALEDDETWAYAAEQLSSEQPTVFHNSKFDLKFMRRNLELHDQEYWPIQVQDTMILNYLLDERPMGKYGAHSLEGMARSRYDAPDYGIDMGKWLKALPDVPNDELGLFFHRMYKYCAVDCYYTARLYPDLLDAIEQEDPNILRVYDGLLMPAAEALADVELRGIRLDVERLERLRVKLDKSEQRLLRKIRSYVAQWQEADEFNPNSAKQLKAFVYDVLKMPPTKTERRGKLQEGPTSSAVFKILAGQFPEHKQFFMDVIEYRTARKTIGTYIKGLLDRMDDDGRIRCDLLLNGTTTGRLSSRNPNLQNIPEVSHVKIDIRECFIPDDPDEWALIEGDYSQLELRVAAHLSEDEAWLQVYLEDRDLHQDVAGALYKRPRDQITPYQRWLAKCTVFGAMYGRGAKSIALGPEMDYIENEMGGVRWTLEQAQEYFDNFFAKYHQFKDWIDNQHALVYDQHFITTPFGRRRRFPFIPRNDNGLIRRQAVNNPIQSTASDITLSALVRIHHRLLILNAKVGHVVAHVVLTVHDSVMVECHIDFKEKVERIMRQEMMERLPIVSRVPFKADLHVASTWSGLK